MSSPSSVVYRGTSNSSAHDATAVAPASVTDRAVSFSESKPFNWRRNRVRGGAPATDTERIIMFCLVMIFCGALVTGIIGSTLYILKVNANVRKQRQSIFSIVLFRILLYRLILCMFAVSLAFFKIIANVALSLSSFYALCFACYPQSNLRVTTCEVMSVQLADDLVCQFEKCINTECKLESQKCFEPQWEVQYGEVDSEGEVLHRKVRAWITDSSFRDKTVALGRLKTYVPAKKYKCSYDASDVANVTWGHDDPEPWMITMIVAWCVIGLFLCAMGFGWFFSKSRDV